MRVCICSAEIKQWNHLGIVRVLYGIEVLPVVHFCACGDCEGAQPLCVEAIQKRDVEIFCQVVDGILVTAEKLNFKHQSILLQNCLADPVIVSRFHVWATQVASLSNDPVTKLSAFCMTGQVLEISPLLANEVLNSCDNFSLADRVRFCIAHDFRPAVENNTFESWLHTLVGLKPYRDITLAVGD